MESNIISIVLISTFIFWIFHVQRRVFFYLYFWQLKSYRVDRFLEEIKRNKEVLFPKICIPALILILFFNLPVNANLVFYLSAIFYLILGCRSFALIFAKKWKMPSFTKKMFFISVLAFIFLAILCFYFWRNIIIFILLLELLMPIFIFLSLGIIEIPANIFKRYLMFKARKKREKFKDLIVIGITGSYGKSSTKEFLYTMLSKKYGEDKVLKTEGNVNTEIGVANTVLKKLNNNHKFFICEMGAYKRGEIRIACNIVMPKIGILTGINEQHLALFGSMENLISAEGGKELTESLPNNGVAILNGDNEIIKSIYKIQNYPEGKPSASYGAGNSKLKSLIFCSTEEKTNLWAENIIVERDWLYFKVCDKTGDTTDFKVNLVGQHNIENILLAAACAKELGMTLPEIAKACEKVTSDQGAMKLFRKEGSADIIDSGYSANPDGVMAALEHLKLWSCQKVIIMPCLIELGPAAKEVHQRIGRKIAEVCDPAKGGAFSGFAIITTKDWFEEIKKTAVAAGMKPENIIFSENPKEIFEKTKSICQPESIILLEGGLPQKLKELKELLKI